MADISKITLLDGVTYNIKDAYAREHANVSAETGTIGSASAGTAITATEITNWNAGSVPTLGTAIAVDDITAWDEGSTPTLGTAISADDITAWTTNTPTSFVISGEKLTITAGTAASLSYTAKSIPNVTSVGSVPSLSYTAKSIPNVTSVGTAPSLTKENHTIPNITVTPTTVVTSITGGGGSSDLPDGDEVSY